MRMRSGDNIGTLEGTGASNDELAGGSRSSSDQCRSDSTDGEWEVCDEWGAHGEQRPALQIYRMHPNVAFTSMADEDDYDPRNPAYIIPASPVEIAEKRARLLEKQVAALKAMERRPAGASWVPIDSKVFDGLCEEALEARREADEAWAGLQTAPELIVPRKHWSKTSQIPSLPSTVDSIGTGEFSDDESLAMESQPTENERTESAGTGEAFELEHNSHEGCDRRTKSAECPEPLACTTEDGGIPRERPSPEGTAIRWLNEIAAHSKVWTHTQASKVWDMARLGDLAQVATDLILPVEHGITMVAAPPLADPSPKAYAAAPFAVRCNITRVPLVSPDALPTCNKPECEAPELLYRMEDVQTATL